MNADYIELSDSADNEDFSEEEVKDYALWMGMRLPEDNQFLWIAKEAINAKLPPQWKRYQKKDGTGEPFYFNQTTGESIWDHPLDAHYRELYIQEKDKANKQTNTSAKQPAKKEAQVVEKQPKQKQALLLEDDYDDNEEEELSQDPFVNEDSDSDSIPRLHNKPADIKPQTAAATTTTAGKQNKVNDKTTTATTNQNSKKQVQSSSNKNAELENIKQKHQNEIDEENRVHAEKMNQLRSNHNTQLEMEKKQLKDRYDADIQQERNRYDNEVQRIRSDNQKGLTELQKSQLNQQKNTFDEKKRQIEQDNNKELDNLRLSHKKEIDFVNSSFLSEKATIEQKNRAEILNINSIFIQEKSSLEKKNRTELDQLVQKHTQQMEQLKQKYATEIKTAQRKAKKQINKAQLEQDVGQYKKQLEEKKNQMLEEFNQNIELMNKKQIAKKRMIVEQMKTELADFKTEQTEKLENAKRRQTDANILNDLQTNYEAKKKKYEGQFQEELDSLTEEHKRVLDDMKKKHLKLVQILNDEDEEMKTEAELSKKEFMTKKKREMLKLRAQQESQISEMIEQFELRKKQETMSFQKEMQDLYSSNEKEKNQFAKKQLKSLSISSYPPVIINPQSRTMKIFSKKVFSQKPNQNQPSSQQLNYSMPPMSAQSMQPEIRYQQTDEISIYKFQKNKGKLSKTCEQFDSTCDSIESSMKAAQFKMQQMLQTNKAYINEQNRLLPQFAVDFQQLTTNISSGLHSTKSDIENSNRAAINSLASHKNSQISVPSPMEAKIGRPSFRRKRQIIEDSQDSISGTDNDLTETSDRMLRLWRQSREKQRN